MAVNSIGSLTLTRFLTPMPAYRPKKQFIIETKPGLDGFAAIYTGRWGEPFQLATEVVVQTQGDAETIKVSHQDSPGLSFGNIVMEDVDYSTQGVTFMILNCEVKSIQRVPLWMSSGSVFYGAFIVESVFTLVPKFS